MNKLLRPISMVAMLAVLAGGGLLGYRRITQDNEKYTVTAYFEKGIGLFENSDVNVLGVPVGKVHDVQPVGERVKVVMHVNDEYKIPADATATIVPISVISDRYVQFSPPYEGGRALADGAVLDVDRTSIPAELDDVFKQLKKLLDAIEPGKPGQPGALGELIVQLDDALENRDDDLQGMLAQAARLTRTLADAKEDLSGLLINLDRLFATLATRADSIGTLNRNLAIVMTTLAESRHDLQGALENLGEMTFEVGDLLGDSRKRLAIDIARARKILKVVLQNRASVEESLAWLPIVGEGLTNAYHPPPVDAIDVRDNLLAKICDDNAPEELPETALEIYTKLLCPPALPPPGPEEDMQAETAAVRKQPASLVVPRFDCAAAITRIKRQLRELAKLDLPAEVEDELLRPLNRKIRRLAKRCDELVDQLKDANLLDDLLKELPEIGELPEIPDAEVADGLVGNAAGPSGAVVPASDDEDRREDDDDSWVEGFLNFLGWSS